MKQIVFDSGTPEQPTGAAEIEAHGSSGK